MAALGLLLVAACCGKQQPDVVAPVAKAIAGPRGGVFDVPHVTLVAVTDWQAVLKPCGCTVDLQKGGIERISHAIKQLRQTDDSVLVVHAGSLLADDEPVSSTRAPQVARRMQAFAAALRAVEVAAVALSATDVELGGEPARQVLTTAPWPVLTLAPQPLIPRAQAAVVVASRSGVKVGFLAVDPKDASDDAARQHALTLAVQSARANGAQLVVLLSNLGLRSSRRLVRAVPGIDVVVVGKLDHKIEPMADLEREGETLLVHAARQGAYFSAVTLVPRGAGGAWQEASEFLPGIAADLEARIASLEAQLVTWRKHATVATERAIPFFEAQLADMKARLERARGAAGKPLPTGNLVGYRTVGLPWSAPVDPEIVKIVKQYDDEVAVMNEKAAGPIPQPAPGEAGYVGQAVCVACHQPTAAFVAQDLHQLAWETLEKANKTRDLDCVPCHVTGFGKPGGSGLGKLAHLQDVQCEACHGPGSLHVAAPGKGAAAKLTRSPGEAVCTGCHSPEHAPRFAFDAYRKRLIVPGHGMPLAAGAK